MVLLLFPHYLQHLSLFFYSAHQYFDSAIYKLSKKNIDTFWQVILEFHENVLTQVIAMFG